MEGSTWQDTKGGHWPTAHEELNLGNDLIMSEPESRHVPS